jgi:phage/plasmid-associated DNA primase
MGDDLDLIIRKYSTNSGPGYQLNYRGSEITIRENKIENFWSDYCEFINLRKKDSWYTLSEILHGSAPIAIDGIVRYKTNMYGEELIPDDFIAKIVDAYQEAIKEKLQVPDMGHHLNCVVLKSDDFDNDKAQAFGLRFPFCRINPAYHKKVIRPAVIQKLMDENILKEFNKEPDSKWDEMLNDTTIEAPLPLYGASRSPNIPPLQWYTAFGPAGPFDKDNKMELDEIFEPSRHSHVTKGHIGLDMLEEQDKEYWLPLFLSIGYHEKSTQIRDDDEIEDPPSIGMDGDPGEEDEFMLAEHLIGLLTSNRFSDIIYWKEIGKVLYNITGGSQKGLKYWSQLGKKYFSDKMEELTKNQYSDPNSKDEEIPTYEEFCSLSYEKFGNKNHLTLKTLAFYAKQDNPEQYKAWHSKWAFAAMERAASTMSDVDIAEAFYRQYWLDYVCYGKGLKNWYKFRNHYWVSTVDAIDVSKTMSGSFIQSFELFRHELTDKQTKTKKKKDRDDMEVSIAQIGNLKKQLRKSNYKNTLIKECCDKFHHEDFPTVHDSNILLFPFRNCVVEVNDELKKASLRDGKPEDFITVTAGVQYPKNFTKKTPAVIKFERWMKQLFPDEDLRNEFKKWLASCLRGKNMDKKLPMFTGPPNGGKTTLFNCISTAFGPLHQVFENDMFKAASSAGQANPAMADAKYAKLVTMEEFGSEDFEIPAELLKKWTGNNKMRARKLHENGTIFDAAFKLAFAFNHFPTIKGTDSAIRKRVMTFPMLSTWSDDAPKDEEEQRRKRIFPVDRFFENYLPELAKALVWTMVEYYPSYANEGLKDVDSIKNAAAEYWREVDYYQRFYDACIEKITDDEGELDTKVSLNARVAYDNYCDWFKSEKGEGAKAPAKPTFERNMKGLLGPITKSTWKGYALKDVDEVDVKGKKRKHIN